jgi:hypothetical protein
MFKRMLRALIHRATAPLQRQIAELQQKVLNVEKNKTSPETKISQRHLFHLYRQLVSQGSAPALRDTGYRIFSQFEEDGKLLFIFAALGIPRGTFIDIGAADGIDSNCANLALNFRWSGLFIDGNADNIKRGETYYNEHTDTCLYPPKFIHAMVKRENINDLINQASLGDQIDLMSIDIDGNDYWVWDAIDCVTPSVVIVETHIEFGMRSIVVPYDKDYVYPGKHPDYHGASPVAMAKLANKKGYRLVGSIDYGFNTIYIRRGLVEDVLPEVSPETVLAHPRAKVRAKLFDSIRDWEYVEV